MSMIVFMDLTFLRKTYFLCVYFQFPLSDSIEMCYFSGDAEKTDIGEPLTSLTIEKQTTKFSSANFQKMLSPSYIILSCC